MGLPDDMVGSISKNSFIIELLWGISKMIESLRAGVLERVEFIQLSSILNTI